MTLTSITLQCADADGDGTVDLPNCTSWRQPGANDLCLSPLAAFPGAPSKCRCGSVNVASIPVPKTIEVIKDLVPDTDPGLFDLNIDNGPVEKPNAGDNGTTGKVAVQAGPHSVSESAGTGTALTRYASSITCVDRVGRCTGNASRHCLTDFACDVVGAGSCNLTPTQVASCTNCTTLAVTVPGTQSDIVCTITNTRVNPCDPAPNCSAFNTACGVASCDPNGAVGNCSV